MQVNAVLLGCWVFLTKNSCCIQGRCMQEGSSNRCQKKTLNPEAFTVGAAGPGSGGTWRPGCRWTTSCCSFCSAPTPGRAWWRGCPSCACSGWCAPPASTASGAVHMDITGVAHFVMDCFDLMDDIPSNQP